MAIERPLAARTRLMWPLALDDPRSVEQGTALWFSLRRGRVTASAAAQLLGLSPFGTRQEAHDVLHLELTRVVPPTLTPPPTERMRLGTALEPVARALYENATGKLVRSAG
eukprot:3543271-Prymnesium_polylepis.1